MELGQGEGFWVRWDAVEPRSDPAWQLISKRKRDEFRRLAQAKAAAIWDARVARGEGADGEPLPALSPITIKYRKSAMGQARPSAPPLTPARRSSRTRAWLRARRSDDGIWFYWLKTKRAKGQKRPWGDILGYHARGEVRGAPARDVIGFSEQDHQALERWAAWWWRMNRGLVIAQADAVRKTPVGTLLRLFTPPLQIRRPAVASQPQRRATSTVPGGFAPYRRTTGVSAPKGAPRGLDRLRGRNG
jgi:hypothetical protein